VKITEIRGYHVRHVMSEPVRNSLGTMAERSCLLIELVTDAGLSGWGEALRSAPAAWALLESELARVVLGQTVPGARTAVRQAIAPYQAGSETVWLAVSALDLALWDLQGKIESRPVAELLGGRVRDRPRAYLSGPFMKPGPDPYRDVRREVDDYLAAGFRGFKVRAGVAPRADGAMTADLRRHVGPGVELMADMNAGYARAAAADALARCEDAELLWVEEPIAPWDTDGYEMLSGASRTPLAAGENLSGLPQFADVLRRHAVGIIQPDLSLCGGFTGAMKIAAVAEAFGTPVLPHVFGTVVNFHASLQLAAVLPGYRRGDGAEYPYFEYDRLEHPLRSLLGEPGVNPDGTITIPDAPGLGIELPRELLHPYTTRTWQLRA
jgi:D-galactarolactone cycloisomerase